MVYFYEYHGNTEYNIETQITPSLTLLKVFTMYQMCLWYDKENHKDNVLYDIVIRCINCRKTTGLSVENYNYKDIITKSVLNSVLHHVSM